MALMVCSASRGPTLCSTRKSQIEVTYRAATARRLAYRHGAKEVADDMFKAVF